MLRNIILTILILLLTQSYSRAEESLFSPVRVKDGKLYAGDEELYLNAVGYTGFRPGKDQFDPLKDNQYGYDLLDLDMRRIKEAGFNAIRTYALLDEKLVELAQKHGLWVVAGIWTNPDTNISNKKQVQESLDIVKRDAQLYAKYPNVALLFLINEPVPGRLLDHNTKEYLMNLVSVAKENFPGVLISFANMPNAVFADTAALDVISYNIYASLFLKFQKSIGYRGYVEGVQKLSGKKKPFFISEFGFYAPVPKPNPKENWIGFCVKNEDEQAGFLLRDREVLSQLGLTGMTLMMWHDDWRTFNDVPEARPFIKDLSKNKYIHDMFTQEWGGIVAFDEDIKGKPRKAYYALAKANQALLIEPDAQKLYQDTIPVRLYVTDKVSGLKMAVDGKKIGEISRVSKHWAQTNFPVSFPQKQRLPVKHVLKITVLDASGKTINTIVRNFFTGKEADVPAIRFKKIDMAPLPRFTVQVIDREGKGIPNTRVQWGLFDIFNWVDYGGETITDTDGRAVFSAPSSGAYLAGAGYEFRAGKFKKRCTDMVIAN